MAKNLNISPVGTVSVGAGNGNAHVGASGNPLTGNVGVGAGVSSGDVNAGVGVGFNPGSGQFGINPSLTIGHGTGAQAGAGAGGIAGSILGAPLGPLGAVAGSTIGGTIGSAIGNLADNLFGGDEEHRKDHEARNSVVGNLQRNGVWDQNNTFTFPDGTSFHFGMPGTEGQHQFKDQSKRNDNEGDRPLFNFDTDYTNDADFVSGLMGVNLSRLLNGTKNKGVDQVGNMMGNAFLGKVGYGAELNKDTFNHITDNARAMYARAGVKSKEDMIGLANRMFADGRINDIDYGTMQQTASMVFDKNYSLASSLMGGRWEGLKAASAQGAKGGLPGDKQNRPGRIHSPVISPEEALLSVQPYFDYYREHFPIVGQGLGPSKTSLDIAHGLGTLSAIAGGYKVVNEATNGGLGDAIKNGLSEVGDFLGLTSVEGIDSSTLLDTPDSSLSGLEAVGDLELPDTISAYGGSFF